MINKERIVEAYRSIQNQICNSLERADGEGKFQEELWEREGGGGGRTRVLQRGLVIEKGGVNFSAVHGKLSNTLKKALSTECEDFFATGVSIVMHPDHPFVPIIHMNIRYFEMDNGMRWFGGGIDLTPHYIVEEDAKFFHQTVKGICDRFNPNFYTKFKAWADDYFFIKHRDETRGIGGIFYDRLTPEETGLSWEQLFEFSKSLGEAFASLYIELIHRNRNKTFTQAHRRWQNLRRSRYVEFNLIYDQGTHFGLQSKGRVDSIFISLPPQANWEHGFYPESGSLEQQTQDLLKRGITWAS